MTNHWSHRLVKLGACERAINWAVTQPSLEAAWQACERGDWMLCYAGNVAGKPWSEFRKRPAIAAAECARLVLPIYETSHPGNTGPRRCIEVVESWARNEGATKDDVMNYRSVALAAAESAGSMAAASAAVSAFESATVAYVLTSVSIFISSAVIYAASAAWNSSAVCDRNNARKAMHKQCADIVRKHYPSPPGNGS